ncbi:MAG: aminoacyl-tRNA deacylase [bacterium]
MPVSRLKEFLDSHNVRYVSISHSPAFTAQGIAASAHVPGKELAKSVVVKLDGEVAIAVLPAPYKVDFELLKEIAGVAKVELATEEEFESMFPGCEVGAMPPFGNLYGMKVFASETLAEDEEIVFNACSHTELVKMSYADFLRLAAPIVGRFSFQH